MITSRKIECFAPCGPPVLAEALAPLAPFVSEKARLAFRPCASHLIPKPYHQLLVHERDLTPTLEAWYGCVLEVKVLALAPHPNWYQRLVVLSTDEGRPVSLGAIRLALSRLQPAVQQDVLAGRVPVGRLLLDHVVPHRSCPHRFFTVPADLLSSQSLLCPEGTHLFGRCNVLRRPDGEPLAEVVEILAPAESEAD